MHVFRTSTYLSLVGRKFHVNLLHADVPFPLLGADFVHQHQLLVDEANCCLVDATHLTHLP